MGNLEHQRKLVRRLKHDPLSFWKSKESFLKGAHAFLQIKDKEDKIGPWVPNNAQHILLNVIFECIFEGVPVRALILKSRQMGMSTGVGGVGFMHTMTHPGANLLIATEEKQGSGKNIYNMYRLYKETCPVQFSIRHEVDNELIEFGPDLNNSLIRVSGERKVTSYTYKVIHLSEAAKFQDLNRFLEEMLQTVPMHIRDTMIFIESTAEAYGDNFHELWQNAEKGGRDGVGWKPVFIPWFVHEEYEFPFKTDEERNRFESSLGYAEDALYGDEVSLLQIDPISIPTVNGKVNHVEVTLEKLKWRRNQLAIMNFSHEGFKRQYPITAEEAFLTSVLNVLDRPALNWYTKERVHDPETEKLREPVFSGEFFDRDELSNESDLKPTRHAIVHIFEQPKQYHEYIIGADLAQGLESGDFSCGIVVCRLPFRVVARLRGLDGRRLDPYEFARQLYHLGRYYNDGWMVPENNADGGGVIRALLDWRYPNLVQESLITGNTGTGRHGWMNNGLTKKRMVGELQRVIRERTIDITDELIIEEAKHLIYKSGQSTTGSKIHAAKKGQRRRPGSLQIGYYDDTIFALGGALLLESVLEAPRTPKVLEQEARMSKEKSRIRNRETQYDENEWLNYV